MKTPLDILHKHFHHFKSERTRGVVVKAMSEYAHLYAQEKLKGLLDEVNLFAQVFEQKSESAEDEGQGCHLSGRAAVYREIATRIEELIGENTNNETK